jgi:hypothetical protein
MYALRTPRTYTCWYGKKWQFNQVDYWNDSIITHKDVYNNLYKECTDFHYGGTGGSIIDVTIFNIDSELWTIPTDLPSTICIYKIEDLWLSFILRKIYHWNIKRSFLPDTKSIAFKPGCVDKDALATSLKKEKNIFLKYLIHKYGL